MDTSLTHIRSLPTQPQKQLCTFLCSCFVLVLFSFFLQNLSFPVFSLIFFFNSTVSNTFVTSPLFLKKNLFLFLSSSHLIASMMRPSPSGSSGQTDPPPPPPPPPCVCVHVCERACTLLLSLSLSLSKRGRKGGGGDGEKKTGSGAGGGGGGGRRGGRGGDALSFPFFSMRAVPPPHIPSPSSIAKQSRSSGFLSSSCFPTSNGGMQDGSSVGTCTRCIHDFFARLAPDFHARSVIISKFSASELGRKLVRSALLLVGFLCLAVGFWTRLPVCQSVSQREEKKNVLINAGYFASNYYHSHELGL